MCHFRKNDLMSVIIYKNDKYLVTLYNVIFSYMTGILSHLSYIFSLEMKYTNRPLLLCKHDQPIMVSQVLADVLSSVSILQK